MTLARVYCWLAGHHRDTPQQPYDRPRCQRCGYEGRW